MTDSVYRKTPLPARLNLNDRNTRQQLLAGPSPEDNGRGTLEGVGPAPSSSASQSQKNCTAVMRDDLRDWLHDHGIDGPPPSVEAERRAMWQWIRDFHKEYNDDWFARNMPRVLEKFRPVFNDEMKRIKAERKAAEPEAVPSQPQSAGDLLGFDEPGLVAAPAASATSVAPVSTAMDTDLLSLDAPSVAPTQASSYSAPPPAPSLPTSDGNADSLLLPMAPASAQHQAAPASNKSGSADLLDLF